MYPDEDNGTERAAGNLTVLLVMILAIVAVFAVNSRLDNAYRGATQEAECRRQTCFGNFGCNRPLYRQCMVDTKPVFDCLKKNPGNRACWAHEGSATK